MSPSEDKPFEPKVDDLCRLHWLALHRRTVSVLEYGSGFSTAIFAHALSLLDRFYGDWAKKKLRCQKPFHVHSVEEEQSFLDVTANRLSAELKPFASLYRSSVELTQIDSRFVTLYSNSPNISPDLIYLDGPSQYATTQEVRGFTIANPERMPIAADIVTFEFFLQPGTLVVIDGRTANARFLQAYLKRNWAYHHEAAGDVHLFELQEEPFGSINKRQMDFCRTGQWLLPER